MTIETKFDFGQDVFFLDWNKRAVYPAKITGVKTDISPDTISGKEYYTVTIYRLDNIWVSEPTLFLSEESAAEALAARVAWTEKREREMSQQ